ncbi:unnamed protein product [Caenorhabditis nigoni]
MLELGSFVGDYKLVQQLTDNANLYSDCEVFEATDKKTQSSVILKIDRYAESGSREVEILNFLSHEFVVKLLESFKTADFRNVMVFEKYPHDLQEIYTNEPLNPVRIQKFMKQLLKGLEYIHEQNIIHRDIKPENLFVDQNNCLRIGDFGLARFSDPDVTMTPESVSLWYRPIEILLGAINHTTAVDIWSAGCVMAELYRRHPLFRGESQIHMINKIIKVLGKPTTDEWPTLNDLPAMQYVTLDGSDTTNFEQAIPQASEKSLDLIRNMIRFDPTRRFTATQLLQHDYFGSEDSSMRNTSMDDPEFP